MIKYENSYQSLTIGYVLDLLILTSWIIMRLGLC